MEIHYEIDFESEILKLSESHRLAIQHLGPSGKKAQMAGCYLAPQSKLDPQDAHNKSIISAHLSSGSRIPSDLLEVMVQTSKLGLLVSLRKGQPTGISYRETAI